jgi:hypothetical protein
MSASAKQLANVLDHIVAAVEGLGPLIASEQLDIEQRGLLMMERTRLEITGMRMARQLEKLEPTSSAPPAGGAPR